MMMSKRERVIAVVAGSVVGLLLLDQVLLTPLSTRLAKASDVVEQQQGQLNEAGQLFQNRLRAQRRWRDIAGSTLTDDAPSAESQVLNRVREWAQSTGLSLTSLKPERNEKERDFQKITIRATATGSMSQIARFLSVTEKTEIPLRITDMQIAARKEATDDLALQIGLATICMPAPDASKATPSTGVAR